VDAPDRPQDVPQHGGDCADDGGARRQPGLYNGFLAAGLLWGALHPTAAVGRQIAVFFLACVVVAGCFGALTASKRILYLQAVPALVALAFVLLRY
jgi:uncharacterized membrane protein